MTSSTEAANVTCKASGAADGHLKALAIVVVNYGSHELLKRNLISISRQMPEAHVVVVDNFTTTGEREAVSKLCAREGWSLVCPEGNLGFGGGVNRGVQRAMDQGAQTFLIINPDAVISRPSVQQLFERVQDDDMALVSPRVLRPDGSVWFDGASLLLDSGDMVSTSRGTTVDRRSIPWLSGACLMASRELWTRVGGFDEDYFLYWEDVDLSLRVSRAGGRLVLERAATAVHDEGGTQRPDVPVDSLTGQGAGPSSRSNAKSEIYYYYNVRNRLLFAAKHLDQPDRRRWNRTSYAAAKHILLRGGRRQFLRPVMPVGAALRGSLDGAKASRAHKPGDRPLVVLLSFPPPRPTSNPYNVMLAESVRAVAGVRVTDWSWRAALLSRYDVFHAHWPEILVSGHSPAKKLVRQLLFCMFLLRLEARRVPWVQTVHNVDLPSGISRREQALLRLAHRRAAMHIMINTTTEAQPGPMVERILHGHYRDWFGSFVVPERVRGRISYFGTVRRYKGVESLVQAFRGIADPSLSLHIAGRLSSADLEVGIRALAGDDSRIAMSFSFLSDGALVREVGEAELVVLPYPKMHNSGATLAALSLGRPVLVPANAVNQRLSVEVGPGWVHLYDGDLGPDDLLQALTTIRQQPVAALPNLGARDWGQGGRDHVAAYRRAVALHRKR